jgi:hypothetical protein
MLEVHCIFISWLVFTKVGGNVSLSAQGLGMIQDWPVSNMCLAKKNPPIGIIAADSYKICNDQ